MFPNGTSVRFDELPLTVRLPGAVSASPTVNPTAAVAVSSLTVWLAMLEIVGGVFTALTVSTNVSLVLLSTSPIVNGMAAVGVFTVVSWFGISLIVGAAPVADKVFTVKLQPPAKLPESPAPSSTTYNDHVPFGSAPLKVA